MSGKVIAITGANGGLGQTLAKRFASEGETVVLLGRTLEKVQRLAGEIGERAFAIQCVVSSPDSVRAAFAQIADRYSKLDVLINNAAVFDPVLIDEASDERILDSVLSNLAGPILCARSAIPMLKRGGHIINVSSEVVVTELPHLVLYQSTKAGLERFSSSLNLELADKGVRVSTVRAGQMIGPGMQSDMDPIAMGRMLEAALKRGFNMMTRGMSQYRSVTSIFRTIIDSPPDVYIGQVNYQGRPVD
jgi:NAD(P)-dependent dehydrogenase (short-subunit alcohol dehydrogenase family)